MEEYNKEDTSMKNKSRIWVPFLKSRGSQFEKKIFFIELTKAYSSKIKTK